MSNSCSGGVMIRERRKLYGFDTQSGASLVEFSIVGLSVILVGLFTLQLGLIYHAKTTLNYAVFEAARSGAVNNASMSAIRDELGFRLAPLQGGDGTRQRALFAVTKSTLSMKDPVNTKVVILNPTRAAFKDWSVRDQVSGERFIPSNHLRHQSYAIGTNSGLSLRDANLLKVQVTHGVDLRVPVVGKLMSGPMKWIDSANAAYYVQGKWPIQSVATVRMQSDSFESEILKSASSNAGSANQGSGGINDDVVSESTSGLGAQTDEETDNEHSSENDHSDNSEYPITDSSTDDANAGQLTDEGLGPKPPSIPLDCNEYELAVFAVASSGLSSDMHQGLINTSRFRELIALESGE